MSNPQENTELINLTSANSDLKIKIANIIENINQINTKKLEDQLALMLENMMNFFSEYIDEVPNFDSLTLEQQKFLIIKFKSISKKLKKVKSVNEAIQIFVYTVLDGVSQIIDGTHNLTSEEILAQTHKNEFRSSLRKAADQQIYQDIDGSNSFIKLGMKIAAKNYHFTPSTKSSKQQTLSKI